MELKKDHWMSTDKKEFLDYLETLSKGKEKAEWEKRIVNTNLPCLAIPADKIKYVCKEIKKGNFIEFIELDIWDNFSAVSIMGNLICQIQDIETMSRYLDLYSKRIDNWAHCDLLKFTTKNNEEFLISLSNKYLKSDLPFQRRVGLIILLKMINERSVDHILKVINSLESETDYYVNMANAWLLCDCFIKFRDKALGLLKNHSLNKFTINKAISKCRDSFRVSKEDKELLLQFKIK